jgi:hypothetical protein
VCLSHTRSHQHEKIEKNYHLHKHIHTEKEPQNSKRGEEEKERKRGKERTESQKKYDYVSLSLLTEKSMPKEKKDQKNEYVRHSLFQLVSFSKSPSTRLKCVQNLLKSIKVKDRCTRFQSFFPPLLFWKKGFFQS